MEHDQSRSLAFVLNHQSEAESISGVVELLDHFGVDVKRVDPDGLRDHIRTLPNLEKHANHYLVATPAGLTSLEESKDGCESLDCTERFQGTFLFGLNPESQLPMCLEPLSGGAFEEASLTERYQISDRLVEVCGPMSGLTIDSSLEVPPFLFSHGSRGTPAEPIIFCDGGWLFARVRGGSSEAFAATSACTVALGAEQTSNLKASSLVSELLPFLMWIRHTFSDSGWQLADCGANLIIDDPLLKPEYGFLDLTELLDLVGPDFAATIGFIPCNHKRTAPSFATRVREKYPQFSICVHGCYHSRGEFGNRPDSELIELAHVAHRDMEHHRESTSIPFENVMVFPQGIFSANAMKCLRRAGYLAAVNTEILDVGNNAGVEMRSLLQPAVLCHGGAPLLLRRNVTDDISSIALDLLIGKPCLLVAHHDYFSEGMQPLKALLSAIHNLSASLTWTNLEAIVGMNYWIRPNGAGETRVRLFTEAARMEAPAHSGRLLFEKAREGNSDTLRVLVGGTPVEFESREGLLTWGVQSDDYLSLNIEIEYERTPPLSKSVFSQSHRMRWKIRRSLSEIRDDYLMKATGIYGFLQAARRQMKRSGAG